MGAGAANQRQLLASMSGGGSRKHQAADDGIPNSIGRRVGLARQVSKSDWIWSEIGDKGETLCVHRRKLIMPTTRTTLAGTFVAEKTHSQPPKYTLVSLDAAVASGASGGNGLGEESGPSAGGNRGAKRRMASEKGSVKCTYIRALDNLEPLLDPEESIASPRLDGRTKAPPMAAAAIKLDPKPPQPDVEQFDLPPLPGQAPPSVSMDAEKQESTKPASKAGARSPTHAVLGPTGTATGSGGGAGHQSASVDGDNGSAESWTAAASGRQEVFNRLAAHERPWVAGKTDTQLLTYLAKRSKDPQIANPRELASSSVSARLKQRHKNHRELFDSCLDRGTPALSKPLAPRSVTSANTSVMSMASVSSTGSLSSPSVMSNRRGTSRSGATPRSPAASDRGRQSAHQGAPGKLRPLNPTAIAMRRGSTGGSRRLYDVLDTLTIVPVALDPVGEFLEAEAIDESRRAAQSATRVVSVAGGAVVVHP